MKFEKISKDQKKWFVSVLKKDVKLLYGSIFLGMMAAFLGLSVSVFSQILIDEIIPSNDKKQLVIGLGVASGLIILKIFISYLKQYLGLKHGKEFNLRLIDKFFNRLLFLPKLFFDEQKTGGLISRMNDSGAIHQTVSFIANTLLLNVLILVVSATVLFYYAIIPGIIALLSFPAYLMIAFVYKNKLAEKNYLMMDANAAKESNYISTIQNIDLVKTHNKQESFNALNNQSYRNFQDKSFDLGTTGMKLGILSEGTGTLTYLIILSYTSFQVINGHLSIGEFTATLGIATGMLHPIGEIGLSILHLQGAKVAFERMYELISKETEFDSETDHKKEHLSTISAIEFRNVSFTYDQNRKLLDDVNFKVTRGEMVSLFGKNGAGKSTILNIIMSMYQPIQGEVFYSGVNAQKLSTGKLREKIAIVSQQSKLFDTSIIDNICFDISDTDKTTAISFLNKKGFEPFIDKLPQGYYTVISENGKNLSGGQKQIISLARALLKQPDVLLLDEPTASLDGNAEMFVMNRVQEFSENGIVIMVSHKLKHAKASKRILILEEGVIINEGNHDELIAQDNLYSKSHAELVF